MKTFLFTIILGLVASTLGQYGIPDDDDDDLPATFSEELHIPSEASRLQVTPTPASISYTKYEDEEPLVMKSMSSMFGIRQEQEAPLYTQYTVPAPILQSTRAEFREENVNYEQPLRFAVRSTDTPTIVYSSPVERSIFPSPASTQIRFTSDYSSQQGYYGEARSEAIPIVKYIMDDDNRGTFRLETVTGDGTSKTEFGQLKDLGGSEGPVVVKSGSYRYTGDDGKIYQVDWKADEGGFQAFGDHLPKSPSPLY